MLISLYIYNIIFLSGAFIYDTIAAQGTQLFSSILYLLTDTYQLRAQQNLVWCLLKTESKARGENCTFTAAGFPFLVLQWQGGTPGHGVCEGRAVSLSGKAASPSGKTVNHKQCVSAMGWEIPVTAAVNLS